MTRCRSCGQQILWVRMKSGRSMPCDTLLIPYRQDPEGELMLVTPEGTVVRGTEDRDSPTAGYRSHFATCPNAGEHRRKKSR